MIGDSKRDIEAGINAQCHTALIGQGDVGQEWIVNSLNDFVDKLMEF